jgi:hypothetical protein
MTSPQASTEDRLPPARMVRWVLLAAVILFAAGVYFRFGLDVQPLGSVPATTPTP